MLLVAAALVSLLLDLIAYFLCASCLSDLAGAVYLLAPAVKRQTGYLLQNLLVLPRGVLLR